MPAEAEVVRDDGLGFRHLALGVGRVVEVALGVERVVVDRGRHLRG